MILTEIYNNIVSVEHSLSISYAIYYAHACLNRESVESFFRQSWPQFFHHFTEYSLLKSITLQSVNVYCTVFWNFTDLFIIVISMALATRLRQINQSLCAAEGKVIPAAFWETHRIYYQTFKDLLLDVDDSMGFIVILSLSVNLYFVCIQLFNSIKWVRHS